MTLLSMIFGGCFGGYRMGGCNNGFPMGDYNNILMRATMQTMQTMSSGIFGYGFPGMMPSVDTHAAPVTVAGGGGGGTALITQEQVDAAKKNYDDTKYTLDKVTEFKTNPAETAESLANKVTETRNNFDEAMADLAEQQAKLKSLTDKDAIAKINKYIQEENLQGKIMEAEKAYKQALLDEQAFKIAQEKDDEKIKLLQEEVNNAFKIYQDLQMKRLNQQQEIQMRELNANAVENARTHDKSVSGSKWSRSKWNPKNWTNLNFKGERDYSANIAKCMRLLHNKGREQAIAYAKKHNLIVLDGNNHYKPIKNFDDNRLKDLCDLLNTQDKVYTSKT